MYLSIIILPLLGSIVSGFFGRKIGVAGSHFLSCLCIIITTILAIISFFEVGFSNNPVSIDLFKWLDNESFNMVWNFQFDSLTVSMLIPVLIVSSLVHFYSVGYMSHDPHNQRFFSYLSLFTFMMIILVTGNNYLLMFVGWEGVGVCSYLLVSFWFTRIAANQSSMAAFLTNRVGDCFLTIGMLIVLWSLGNLDYSIMYSISPYINDNTITIIGLCLLIGAMAKSSQVGLHIWLPMAMEGPTPVSALIHAATMVTAGVYLLIRSSPLIEYSSTTLLICLWLGAITTIFSSLIGLFQHDIKKIIAYSTMSQLGMMVIAIGLSSYNVAIFHLINHAFYKGLLFLGAGAVIHAIVDNQDLRKYGGLISFLPLSYSVILIASLSLVALPFMTGYYSKDFILESAYGQYHFSSINVYIIAVIGAIFTTLYSVKVIFLTFLAAPNGSVNYYKNAHESDIFISLPLVILAIFSIYFGFLTKDIFIGLGSGFFGDNSIFIHPTHEILINTEFAVPTIFKLIPFIFTVSFILLAMIYSEFMPIFVHLFKISNIGYYIFGFFNQRFLIEFFYNNFIINPVLHTGGDTTKSLDKGSVEWFGPYGFYYTLTTTSKDTSSLSEGVVTNYALYVLLGACSLIFSYSFVVFFGKELLNPFIWFMMMVIWATGYIISIKFKENNEYSLPEATLTSDLGKILKNMVKFIIKFIAWCIKKFVIFFAWLFFFVLSRSLRKVLHYWDHPENIIFMVLKLAITFIIGQSYADSINLDSSDKGSDKEASDDEETKSKIDKGKGVAVDDVKEEKGGLDTNFNWGFWMDVVNSSPTPSQHAESEGPVPSDDENYDPLAYRDLSKEEWERTRSKPQEIMEVGKPWKEEEVVAESSRTAEQRALKAEQERQKNDSTDLKDIEEMQIQKILFQQAEQNKHLELRDESQSEVEGVQHMEDVQQTESTQQTDSTQQNEEQAAIEQAKLEEEAGKKTIEAIDNEKSVIQKTMQEIRDSVDTTLSRMDKMEEMFRNMLISQKFQMDDQDPGVKEMHEGIDMGVSEGKSAKLQRMIQSNTENLSQETSDQNSSVDQSNKRTLVEESSTDQSNKRTRVEEISSDSNRGDVVMEDVNKNPEGEFKDSHKDSSNKEDTSKDLNDEKNASKNLSKDKKDEGRDSSSDAKS